MTTPLTRPTGKQQDRFPIPVAVPTETVTTAIKLGRFLDREYRIDAVWLNLPAGFASGATGWNIQITDGTNILASWNTTTGNQGAITANTPVYMVLAAMHDLAPGLDLTLNLAIVGGAGALPAGQIFIDGRLL